MATTTHVPMPRTPDGFRADIRRTRQPAGRYRRRRRSAAIALPPSPSAHAINGRSVCWRRKATTYSSSVNPISHDLYGMPDAPRVPFRPGGGTLWEIPMTTVRAFGRNWPCSGGGFFRLLPYPRVSRRPVHGEPARAAVRHLLFPSVGDRSGAAACRRVWLEVALPALHQPVAHGRAGSTGCCVILPGIGWIACLPISWHQRRAPLFRPERAAAPLPA